MLLAGDVVEQSDDFYEAYRDLRKGIEELIGAGVSVCGVAGNHDSEVLPYLARAVPDFHLLGAGGKWESMFLKGHDGMEVQIIGWSFPERVVTSNPLTRELPSMGSWVTLGLLHCDRDIPGSRYAPVSSRDLERAPVDAWLLGHIHKPDSIYSPRPAGFLGSILGLDPSETGPHGPWLLEISLNGELDIKHLPLSPLRWEEIHVSVEDLEMPEDVHIRLTRGMDSVYQDLLSEPALPLAVGCRIRLQGRTPFRAELGRLLSSDDPRKAPHYRDETLFFVHDWQLEALPSIDLEELARGDDPASLLAKKILVLQEPSSPERSRLIKEARQQMLQMVSSRNFALLGAEPPDDEKVAEYLTASALRALDDILAQKRGSQ